MSKKTKKSNSAESAPVTAPEAAPKAIATQVLNQRVSRGPKNLPGYYVAICDAAGNALSTVYKCIGEDKARNLSLRMSINHRLPQAPGIIIQTPAAIAA